MSKMIDMGITENELLAELTAPYQNARRQPGDVDKEMFAEAAGLSPSQASKRLKDLTRQGILTERRVFEGGKWLNVYSRAVK